MHDQTWKRPAKCRRPRPASVPRVSGEHSESGPADRRAMLAGFYVAGLLILAAGWLLWVARDDFMMAGRVATQTLSAAADVQHLPAGQPVVVTGKIDAQAALMDDTRRLTMYVDWKPVPKGQPVEARREAPPFALAVTDGSVPIANEGYALRNLSEEASAPVGTMRRGLRRGDAVVVVGSVVDGGVAADTVVGGDPAAYSSALRSEGLGSLLLGLGAIALSLVAGGLGAWLWRRR
jgi:hypothetical protein